MKPRHVHKRRALFLLPLLLLGGALLIRSRLPQPSTEGDKWLWEQAETATSLEVEVQALAQDPWMKEHRKSTEFSYLVTNRRGMRTLLRAFKGATAFAPISLPPEGDAQTGSSHTSQSHVASSLVCITIKHSGGLTESLYLLKRDGKYELRRWTKSVQANVDAASVQRFNAALRMTILQAQQGRQGYSAVVLNLTGSSTTAPTTP